MTSIAFDQIPAGQRLPGSQVEFSNVRALQGLPVAEQKRLIIGQRTSAGTVAALTVRRISRVDEANAWFGRGSQLAAMVAAALAANSQTEMWAIALDDNAEGTAAQWTITLTGPSSAAGTLSYLIGGVPVPVAVASGASATTMATAVAAAINAKPDLPLTATSSSGVVTLTFRHKGTIGNDLYITQNHYDGEALPAGVTSAIAATTAGATDPDLSTVWAAIGDEQYQTIALGLNSGTALSAADTELASRWGPQRQIFGRAFAGTVGSFSTVTTFGATRNGIFTTLIPSYKMPTPPWCVAAAFASVYAFHVQIDPARPFTGLTVPGVMAPRPEHRYIRTEREQMLSSALSAWKVTAGGEVAIERLISTYRVNTLGYADISWLDVNTTATLDYYRFSLRSRIEAKFPRAKLTDDTLRSIRAEIIALAQDWYDAGLMEDVAGFIARLVIERDAANPTQLNVLMAPDTVNGLLQFAARVEFIL
ncbi:phage tail sheath subtilisin-like domain-containing protein [Sphingomonas canadensis]|uniref:Phage tail sheath subtilisin-like domain-containing protein n=1 Tax=Sphingomonas canadensis TaxID=1219257 RepID=A0ABW3H484_9SPHN|nr:phage tail sheath subtilisin-like domain-containing protein [Sphingomonas canadensis]MCW3835970.1 phage tail sheath subtilisin-like domain-containing protein [Sphingomonas canadensis]